MYGELIDCRVRDRRPELRQLGDGPVPRHVADDDAVLKLESEAFHLSMLYMLFLFT